STSKRERILATAPGSVNADPDCAAISEMREPRAGFLRAVTGDFLFAARRGEPVHLQVRFFAGEFVGRRECGRWMADSRDPFSARVRRSDHSETEPHDADQFHCRIGLPLAAVEVTETIQTLDDQGQTV